ncbi:MerR family transcriptional regulator [Pseudoduganella sp. UC29_71]|jgi:DNA-binding transcriptional MerR regulator|uniref:MerR family transcriptional regulator n=1 Tax=Pseudoduganella sp. UC29_71 TaxID=3350174 RepID=UPI00366D0BB7
MRIGQLARAAGATVRLLRHYEAQGLLQSRRLPNGYRDYPPDAVDRVRWVRELLDCGFSTRQIQGFLHCYGQERADAAQCEAGLAQHREKLRELDQLIAVLAERRARLAGRMAQMFGPHIS